MSALNYPLNRYIDHTLLKVDATSVALDKLLREAVNYNFASVCISPHFVLDAVRRLQDYSEIKVCTVVGFPHGNIPVDLKLQEVQYFIDAGIDEIDFVINIGHLKAGNYETVGAEIESIGSLCKSNNVVSKCIIETCYLDEDEKMFMYRALEERTTVDFIKTSTGFGSEGAFLGDVWKWNARRNETEKLKAGAIFSPHLPADSYLLRDGQPLRIKAAGGIRDLETTLKFIACGADRLGMSASVKVMEEWNVQEQPRTSIEGEESS
jgi:deoxyribose-phosphate aldolase